jgi:hypothetical protein
MMKQFKRMFTMALFLFTSLVMFGQGATTSGINGRIVDSNGQPLAGATVIAVHVPSGTQYGIITNGEGFFTIQGMRPGGPYNIEASFVGYSKKSFTDITLFLGESLTLNTNLSESSTQLGEVTVVGIADKTFNSGRTGAATNVTSSQISSTPTISRSITDMTRLTPQSSGYSFAGRNSLFNNLSIDGSVFNNSFGLASTPGGQTNAQPISLDAIEAIQVSLAPYDVRQSGFTGAGINAITRGGTNEFKGSVYQYWRNENFIGTKVGETEVSNSDFSQKQTGFRIGGPIIKNKLFFFLNAEIERRTDPAHNYLANRGTTGDNISRTLATDLDNLKDFLITNYDYDPGVYENYKYRTSNDKFLARIDYNINENHKFSIRYNYLKSFRDNPPSTSNSSGGRSNGLNFLGFSGNGYLIYNNINSIIGELNSKFGNSASNNLIIGWTGFRDYRESPSGKAFPMVDILSGGSTYTSFGYEQFSINNILNTDVFQISDNFTLYKGPHTITAGGSLESFSFENGYMRQFYGYYRYNSLADFYNDANGIATTVANYQFQYSAVAGDPAPLARLKASQVGIYIQDEWKVASRFKLTAGLRVDMPFYPDNLVKNPALDALSFINGYDGSAETLDVSQLPKTNPLLSPRIGFNYDPFGDRTTQIRGGFGIFTGRIPFVWISNQASNNGLLWGRIEATNTTAYPFSSDITKYIPASPTTPASFEINATSKNFKFPQVFRSNIAIDQKLPFGIVGTLEGIFTKDINAVYHRNDNLPVPTLSLPDGRALFPADITGPPRIYGTRINQNITGAYILDNINKGYSFFVTVQLEKTFDFGLYLMAAYTYGQTKDITSNPGSVASSAFNFNYVKSNPNVPDLAFSNYDQPHKVVGNATYKIDYLDHFSSSISVIYLGYQSGRYSYSYAGDINKDGISGNDLIYVPKDETDIILIAEKAGDTRTPAEMWAQLDAYIIQDDYLNSHRGKIIDRNHSLLPFANQIDLRFTQDMFINVVGKKNTLEFTFDVMNIGNLLNSDWGIYKTVKKYNILQYRDLNGPGGTPRFSFNYFDFNNQVPLSETYVKNLGLGSRWQIQLGIRYIFN